MRLDEPLTFPEAAREVKWRGRRAGQRLRRLVLRREQELNRKIALRDKSGRAIAVTIGALARFFPELRPSRTDVVAESIRPFLAAFRGELVGTVRSEIGAAPVIRKIDERVTILESWRKLTEKYFQDVAKLNAPATHAGSRGLTPSRSR